MGYNSAFKGLSRRKSAKKQKKSSLKENCCVCRMYPDLPMQPCATRFCRQKGIMENSVTCSVTCFGVLSLFFWTNKIFMVNKGKANPLQAWTGPEGSGRLRLPDNWHMKVERHRPPLAPANIPGTQFCHRLSQSQGQSTAGRIMSV